MDILENLLLGFQVALTPEHLLFALIGCVVGTLVGVMPGIGTTGGMALLIPLTYTMSPTGAIIMLAAIYYGAMYGGTITAILVNVPGEAANAVTVLDGHAMAKKGRAGVALSISAIGSFVGGTLAVIALIVAAPLLTSIALKFGPPEFFSLMLVGLVLLMGLAGKSIVKALVMGVIGLMLAMIGIDPGLGIPRFTFGLPELLDGVDFIPVIMGLFGLGEILHALEAPVKASFKARMRDLMPTRQDGRASVGPIARGSAIGVLLGLIPGLNAVVASFMSYVAERKISRTPEKFGTGMIQGVAGPETANNAFSNASMIPLLTLGIPGSAAIAVLMSAFMMNGILPGPFLFTEQPALVWGVIASFVIGNVILLILNLPLISIWVKVLQVPQPILYATIIVFLLIGSYTINNRIFDVAVMVIFGVIGYAFKRLEMPLAPLALTLVLGPLMETKLRQSVEMSGGDLSILVTRPISATLVVIALVILISPFLSPLLKKVPFLRALRKAGLDEE